jgi:uncharacterized HAD superfamily protein
MNLGFDIDGVISDFVSAFIDLVYEKYHVTISEKDIYCHDLNLVLGIRKKERNELIAEILKKDLPLYSGAKETLERLQVEGHNIYLLTARYGDLIDVTRLWLKNKGIPYNGLLQLAEGEKYQANINLDLIVEDCLLDAIEWTQKINAVLILDHPWNQTKNVKNLVKRVHGWDEIYNEINELTKANIG